MMDPLRRTPPPTAVAHAGSSSASSCVRRRFPLAAAPALRRRARVPPPPRRPSPAPSPSPCACAAVPPRTTRRRTTTTTMPLGRRRRVACPRRFHRRPRRRARLIRSQDVSRGLAELAAVAAPLVIAGFGTVFVLAQLALVLALAHRLERLLRLVAQGLPEVPQDRRAPGLSPARPRLAAPAPAVPSLISRYLALVYIAKLEQARPGGFGILA